MKKPVYISPTVCTQHLTGIGHPERAERLTAIQTHLEREGLLDDFKVVNARCALPEELTRVHSQNHLEMTSYLIGRGVSSLGPDNPVSKGSLEAATMAAGAALTGIDLIREGTADRVFCGVRPPGHHAEVDQAMGFCIYNNVAIAAEHARATGLAERILIIDWDVHHGNGTQHIFEESSQVFYYSLHQFPFYPGTGAASEIGRGTGEGFTLNRPLAPGAGDLEYLRLIEKDLASIGSILDPQLIIISAGFDAHRDDPLGSMRVTEQGFVTMTEMVLDLAGTNCQNRVLSVLEGGYDLQGLAASVGGHLRCFLA